MQKWNKSYINLFTQKTLEILAERWVESICSADPLSPNNTFLGWRCYKTVYAFFYISFRRRLRNSVSSDHKNKPLFYSFINTLRH